MKEDVRDERIGLVLDAAVHDLVPTGKDRLSRVVRRGSRRRALRWTVIVGIVVLLVAGPGVAALRLRSGLHTGPIAPDGWATVGSLDANGWTLDYPGDWHAVPLPACSNAPERTGVIVTDTDFEFLNPEGKPPRCGDRLVLDGFPSDGVAVAVEPVGVLSGIFLKTPETPFPISTDQLEPTGGIEGGPTASYLGITVDGDEIASLQTWVGASASPESVDALNVVVGSLEVLDSAHWTTYRDGTDRFEITYPDDWSRAETSLTPDLSDPHEILSIGTYPLRAGGKACIDAYLPGDALMDLGTGDAFITIQESSSAEGFPSRPSSFGPDFARLTVDGLPACDGYQALPLRGWWFAFSEEGRGFYAFVALGPGVSHDEQVLRIAWHILNSFRPGPAIT
jgi:hypothetical protein